MGTAHNGPAERQRPINGFGAVPVACPAQRNAIIRYRAILFLFPRRTKRPKISWSSHLSDLRRQGVIREWHDRKIGLGTEWAKEIDEHLNSAEVILLLISSDFIASEYCHEIEMETRDGAARIRRSARNSRNPAVRGLEWIDLQQASSAKDGAPVTKWADRDEAFMNVAQAIRAAVAELTRRKKESGAKSKARFFMPSILTSLRPVLPASFGDAWGE